MPLVFSGIRLFSFAFARFAGYNRDGLIAYDFFCPVLTTDRLILRPFTTADFGAIFEIFSDETVNTYLTWLPIRTIEEAQLLYKA